MGAAGVVRSHTHNEDDVDKEQTSCVGDAMHAEEATACVLVAVAAVRVCLKVLSSSRVFVFQIFKSPLSPADIIRVRSTNVSDEIDVLRGYAAICFAAYRFPVLSTRSL